MSVVQHYWPGTEIAAPMPTGGLAFDYSNDFVKTLPIDTTMPSNQQVPGNDHSRPDAVGFAVDVLFEITGEGKWVDFYLVSQGEQGGFLRLYERVGDSAVLAPMPDNGTFTGGHGLALAIGTLPPEGGATTALRVFLVNGTRYVLQTGSANWSAAADAASVALGNPAGLGGYDQNFHLEINFTETDLPDQRANAWDVIIPTDGGTYVSKPVLNATFTSSNADDLTTGVLATSWWKYVPTKDTDMSISFDVLPHGLDWFTCTAFQQQDNTLIRLIGVIDPPQTFTVSQVRAGDVIYIQVGSSDAHNGEQSYSQKYQLQVTGAKSQVQGPTGPPNDLRPNAIDVTVGAEGIYLSGDTDLTLATPGALGTVGPYITDPEAPPLYQTAWWSYKPSLSGPATFRAHSSPTDDQNARIEILDHNLTVLGVTGMSQTLAFPVAANQTYYIVLGTANPAVTLSASFGMTGPLTGLGPPVNDLRAHATTVSIGGEGTYLSVDTNLTLATPGAFGAFGPFVTDPEARPLYQTAWWSYQPAASGPVTVRAHSAPTDDENARVEILDQTLGVLAIAGMSETVNFVATTGQTYYVVLGTITASQELSTSFVMTGPPIDSGPPVNDLRAHATAVSIASGVDTYLSVDTQLDFATPAAGGAADSEAPPLFQTTWWIYQPQTSGRVSIRAHSSPAGDPSVKLMVLHDLKLLSLVAMSTDYSHAVTAGQTYYYVLGTTGHALASASFGMTGPVSSTPVTKPPVYTGPWKLNLRMPDATWKVVASGAS